MERRKVLEVLACSNRKARNAIGEGGWVWEVKSWAFAKGHGER